MAKDIVLTQDDNRHYFHMDIMRIVAIFFVIFNHTGYWGFSYFRNFDPKTISYWGYMLFPVIAKISVPLFFTISGALLLNKENESIKKMLTRLVRIFAALLVFSVISYAQQILLGKEVLNIKNFIKLFFSTSWSNAYWYLYAYLAYLCTLPILRKIAKALSDSLFRYMILLIIILAGFLPMIVYVASKGRYSLNTSFQIDWMASSIFIYPLIGYYLEHRVSVESLSAPKLAALWTLNILSIFFTCYVTHVNDTLTDDFPQTYISHLVSINVISIYLTLKKLMRGKQINKYIANTIKECGACTFGVYLFHEIFLRAPEISLYSKISWLYTYIPITAISLRCIEVMLLGGVATAILRRIPGVKKIL